uniref:ubiquitinyl hydrolase 1 n=1 Tax=Onchocerca volvulus TaxID=6282 RepID=A0A8R1TZY7_ONCVO
MGANASSQLEKEICSDHLLSNEHFYGLFGNTCYCNSVIQALYFCRPFREKILQYKQQLKKSYDKESGIFDNFSQQDAHEFLNYLLNTISETLAEEKKAEKMEKLLRANGMTKKGSNIVSHEPLAFCQPSGSKSDATWIQEIFQGTLTNETRCLNCETVSSKDEDFLDLSVDVEQNTSITHCLRVFSDMETLQGEQKYYCENCCSKHEAQKRMRIKKLPQMLALHLKRFKYVEQMSRHTKLSYRVLFPLELRLFNVSDDAVNRDRLYDLCAVVVHCGSTPNRGHYITLVKTHNFWLLFDDDIVDKIDPGAIEDFFGLSECGVQKNSESAYILFYEARDAVNTDIKGGAGQFANSSI